ncbi:Rrf2 family transcriptional regulator [Ruminococcaceae bacterium OttesenSCG-928-A16]|nr:Rrf2 family transcriptional regulator [Ruminococcaceae bacterium OttesenSCG-928-A16]
MKVSTKGRYALRMMVDFALYNTGEVVSLREVAARQEISMKYMEQIVSMLTKAGLLRSTRGPQGGYRLARRPEEYTVEEILTATEGSLAPVACLENDTNNCQRAGSCATLSFWEELYRINREFMQKTTLKTLVDAEREKNGWEYSI